MAKLVISQKKLNTMCIGLKKTINLDLNSADFYENFNLMNWKGWAVMHMKMHTLLRKRCKRCTINTYLYCVFKSSDKVLLYDSWLCLFPRKLHSRWTGQFIVKTIYPYSVIEIKNPKADHVFKVNEIILNISWNFRSTWRSP